MRPFNEADFIQFMLAKRPLKGIVRKDKLGELFSFFHMIVLLAVAAAVVVVVRSPHITHAASLYQRFVRSPNFHSFWRTREQQAAVALRKMNQT